jgi:queuine tRNA-ribosyltransferase
VQHPLFEIVTTTAGALSIRNKALNETMHNPVGPWVEANALYIDQSQLRERLSAQTREELVLFDVGLGAAANALAVLHCARAVSGRPLRIISFERELELLRFALAHAGSFAHFHGYEDAVATLLRESEWQENGITWELRHGDFLATLADEKQKPHLIYYDPYSPKVNRDMWSTPCFRLLREKSRDAEEGGTMFYTYSQATPIRVGLLDAGFFVGHGQSSGPKEETTQAATVLADLPKPLAQVWLERWKRSRAQLPFDCAPEDAERLRATIVNHPQFIAYKV